jgi:hypothetical protein
MARAIRYHPLFDCDVREAAGWYDRRSAGLGDVFVDLVAQTVADVIADPERFSPWSDWMPVRSRSPLPLCRIVRSCGRRITDVWGIAHGTINGKMARTARQYVIQ